NLATIMENRNWLTPVALTREDPVTKLECCFCFSSHEFYYFFFHFLGIHAVKFPRVYKYPLVSVGESSRLIMFPDHLLIFGSDSCHNFCLRYPFHLMGIFS